MNERVKTVGGMIERGETEVIIEISVTEPICQPQIPLLLF
jgi:hypothetical protein